MAMHPIQVTFSHVHDASMFCGDLQARSINTIRQGSGCFLDLNAISSLELTISNEEFIENLADAYDGTVVRDEDGAIKKF